MTWGEWLVPELSMAADLECRARVLALQKDGPGCPEAVLTAAIALTQAWYQQEAIIRKAIARVNELEMQLEFGPREETNYAAMAREILDQQGNSAS